MKRPLSILLLFIFLNTWLNAQTSIGLSSEDPKPLKDYRLPEWGYSRSNIRFNTLGDGESDKNEIFKTNSKEYTFLIRPTYSVFKESETRSLFFDVSFSNSYSYSNNHETNYFYEDKNNYKITQQSWLLQFSNETYNYFGKEYFRISPYLNFYYAQLNNKQIFSDLDGNLAYKNKTESTDRYYDGRVSLSFGTGRVRNVTPVIRALRLNERLKALGKDITFDQAQLDKTAGEFAKFPAYQSTYDRPQKYFWDSFSDQLSNLSSFETHYLNDVFNEAIGTRLEGSEADMGLRIMRIDVKQKIEDYDEAVTTKGKGTFAGPEIRFRIYRNSSLKNQVGITGRVNYDVRLNDKKYNPVKNALQFQTNIQELYVIADQLLFKLEPSYSKAKIRLDDAYGSAKLNTSLLMINSSLSYYVENRYNIEGKVSWSLLKNKPTSTLDGYLPLDPSIFLYQPDFLYEYNLKKNKKSWRFEITFNYYLTRQMF